MAPRRPGVRLRTHPGEILREAFLDPPVVERAGGRL
jgi:plasmid maintenance system antidote protein VapI